MNKDIEIEVKDKIVKEFGSFDRRVHRAIQLTQKLITKETILFNKKELNQIKEALEENFILGLHSGNFEDFAEAVGEDNANKKKFNEEVKLVTDLIKKIKKKGVK